MKKKNFNVRKALLSKKCSNSFYIMENIVQELDIWSLINYIYIYILHILCELFLK